LVTRFRSKDFKADYLRFEAGVSVKVTVFLGTSVPLADVIVHQKSGSALVGCDRYQIVRQ
jgi:hypothetical protein